MFLYSHQSLSTHPFIQSIHWYTNILEQVFENEQHLHIIGITKIPYNCIALHFYMFFLIWTYLEEMVSTLWNLQSLWETNSLHTNPAQHHRHGIEFTTLRMDTQAWDSIREGLWRGEQHTREWPTISAKIGFFSHTGLWRLDSAS